MTTSVSLIKFFPYLQALYEQLVAYLSEHGINEHFADDALEFYKTFEHTCYCNSFLEELKQFLSKQ